MNAISIILFAAAAGLIVAGTALWSLPAALLVAGGLLATAGVMFLDTDAAGEVATPRKRQ